MERLLARYWPRMVAVFAVALGVVGAASLVLGADPRLSTCTRGVAGSVQASFAMAHARDYKVHLPHMKLSPELETDVPAYVVVFSGATSIGYVGAPAPQADDNAIPSYLEPLVSQGVFSGVVCVVTNGSPTYYSSVDTLDLKQ
jgi:amino acid transporter